MSKTGPVDFKVALPGQRLTCLIVLTMTNFPYCLHNLGLKFEIMGYPAWQVKGNFRSPEEISDRHGTGRVLISYTETILALI